MADLNC